MDASIKVSRAELTKALNVLTERPKRDLRGDRESIVAEVRGNELTLIYAGALSRLSGKGRGKCRIAAPFQKFELAVLRVGGKIDGDVEVFANETSMRIGDFVFVPLEFGPPSSSATFGSGLVPDPHDKLDLQVAFDVYSFASLEEAGIGGDALSATNEAKGAVASALKIVAEHGVTGAGLMESLRRAKVERFSRWKQLGCTAADPYAAPAETPTPGDHRIQVSRSGVEPAPAQSWGATQLRSPTPGGINGQLELLHESISKIQQRLGIEDGQFARWRELGWLTFSVEQEENEALPPWVRMEVEFLNKLQSFGIQEARVAELLESLERPYSYSEQRMLLELSGTWWSPCPPDEAVNAWWEYLEAGPDPLAEEGSEPGRIQAVVALLQEMVSQAEE